MTRLGLRRSIPHGFVALSLCMVALLSALTLIPVGVVADTPGGQSSSYIVPPRDTENCVLFSPFYSNETRTSTVVLSHDATSDTTVTTRLRRTGGGTLVERHLTMAGREMRILSASDLGAPASFTGSIELNVEGGLAGLTPTVAATRTPIPASTLIPTPLPTVLLGTPTVTAIPSSTPIRTPTSVVTPVIFQPASCGITGVVMHDTSTGDRTTVEMFRQNDPTEDWFIPAVHKDDNGFNTEVIIQNANRDSEFTATLEFRPDSGGALVERTINIPRDGAIAVDMTAAPQGASTLEIDGAGGARLLATAFHTGPGGMAAGINGISRGGGQITLPLLYRRAGSENAYSSMIRVMKIRPGGVTPKITLWDRDTGNQIGPIVARRASGADVVLRENEAFSWDLTQLTQLADGKVYSARVDSDERGEIGVVAAHLNSRRATIGGYVGVSESSTDRILSAPYVVKNQDNLNAGIQIREFGGTDASVQIRFFNQAGNRLHTEAITVPSFDSRTVYLRAISDADLPNGVYTAEITSSSRVAAVVNLIRYR